MNWTGHPRRIRKIPRTIAAPTDSATVSLSWIAYDDRDAASGAI